MTGTDNHREREPAGRNPGTISTQLLRDVQIFRPDAWRRMSNLYAPLVYYWCRQKGLQASDAEDVVQEVFRTVATRIETFQRKASQSSFRGWLRMITRYKLGDFFRRERRRLAVQDSDFAKRPNALSSIDKSTSSQATSPRSAEIRLLYVQATELIRTEFEERTWRAFLRVVVDEAEVKDVASELGMSTNAVYLARSRVLRRLRDELCDESL